MRKFTKNERGVSHAVGVILIIAIIIILAAVIAAVFFFDLGGASTGESQPKEKNPHIVYADLTGLATVRGISPEEVNINIGEIHKDGCFSEMEHAAEYDPIQNNFYATVYISTTSHCTGLYKQ